MLTDFHHPRAVWYEGYTLRSQGPEECTLHLRVNASAMDIDAMGTPCNHFGGDVTLSRLQYNRFLLRTGNRVSCAHGHLQVVGNHTSC